MQGDSESRLSRPPERDLWALPNIEELTIERVQYDRPRKHVVAGNVVEFSEGIEIVVQTDGEIPMRALSPALYVGSAELAENERVTTTSYRFFVLDEAALQAGASITLGWAGYPSQKARSKFHYKAPRVAGTREASVVTTKLASPEQVVYRILKKETVDARAVRRVAAEAWASMRKQGTLAYARAEEAGIRLDELPTDLSAVLSIQPRAGVASVEFIVAGLLGKIAWDVWKHVLLPHIREELGDRAIAAKKAAAKKAAAKK